MKRIVLVIITALLFVVQGAGAQPQHSDSAVCDEQKVENSGLNTEIKDSILYSKLTSDQLMELKKQENEVELMKIDAASRNDMPLNSAGIVLIVLLPFLFIIILSIIQSNVRDREAKRKYELYMKSLEMGQSIPDHFFDEPKKQSTVLNLKKGIIWLAIGLSTIISILIIREPDALFLGIVPSFVGIGYLLVHVLDKPKKTDEQNG
jgi:hypothetical protein